MSAAIGEADEDERHFRRTGRHILKVQSLADFFAETRLREAADEVRRDIAEVKAGRPGFLRTYSADELLKELHA